MVDHEILLNKKEKHDISRVALDWTKSYIKYSAQYVQTGNNKSKRLSITCGVPQGSALGLKLFISYINDIY